MQHVSEAPFSSLTFGFLPENAADVSDEHGERFHQDIAEMEFRYKGVAGLLGPAMLADFCWNIQRDEPKIIHKNKSKYMKKQYVYLYFSILLRMYQYFLFIKRYFFTILFIILFIMTI